VLLLTGIIAKGLRLSLTFNNVMVAVKMAVILFVIVLGAFYVHPANWQPFAPFGFGFTFPAKGGDPTGVLAGAAFAFYAYLGFDSMTNYTEETVRPQRTVPLSILASMAICTVLYIAMTAVLTGMVPYQQIQMNAPVSAAFRQVGLPWAQLLIAGGALVGITSVLLVILMSLPRILLAIGRDGLLPTGFFTGLHPRTGTPWRSILATGVVIALLSSLAPLQDLTFFVVLSTLCGFIVVAAAVLVLRRTAPDAARPFRVPLGPVLPLVSIAVCLLLAVALPPVNIVRLSAWLALGLVIYFAYSRHHSRLLIDREK
jgi:APA family basic amino acid/polyamine antiporter